MTEITYIFGDAITGRILEEIPLYGVSMSRTMNTGEFRGSFQLDQTGKTNSSLVDATVPGRSFVVCERNGKVIWGGLIRTRTYQSQAKVAQIYANLFDQYIDYRFIVSDTSFDNVEQQNIIRSLFLQMQSVPYSISFDLPPVVGSTLVPKSVSVLASELKTYRQVIDPIAEGDNGVDWRIDVVRNGGIYTRTLVMGYPTLGAHDPATFWFDYPGNILNYWENETMGEAGTYIFGVGAGEGRVMFLSTAVLTDLLGQGFPRYDVDIPMKDVSDQTILDRIVAQEAVLRRPPRPVITAEIKANLDPVFGSYTVGDACTLYFKDPKHPNKFRRTTRVLGWEYYPPQSDQTELARLTFEGDDL